MKSTQAADRPAKTPASRQMARVREASQVTGLSKAAIYAHIARGNLAATRLGKVVLIPIAELRRLQGQD